ncbi:hypothetical protein LTR78_002194 [Recurvomyces mirabilis]|uniref:MATE efflux family protein n=1 Tax=Recurvomyces mirabilis TaxID=574656 RepID=A0AAE0WUZ7_9PEZI|nr:hypothetical protein LTR78_002194 [Recurvomyces mirabilis]KAK5160650.1 hypothetical protein LTS14_001662 [Recurvomyces mirabilis]
MSSPARSVQRSPRRGSDQTSRSLGTSYRTPFNHDSIATIAEEAIAKDIAAVEGEDETNGDIDGNLEQLDTQERVHLGIHAMTGSHRRPSVLAGAPHSLFGTGQAPFIPVDQEWEDAIRDERSLLRDNNLIPPKHPRHRDSRASVSSNRGLIERLSIANLRRKPSTVADEEAVADDETTALLGRDPSAPYGGEDDPENIDKKWEEAVLEGKIQTTWQRETKTLARTSAPLILTFLLQNSLTMTSIFTVGHIGKIELGAVSLGSMTANITGYAAFHGLATSLDTLCAQASGSGRKQLVGLQLQRMVFFLWTMCIPITLVWLSGTQILQLIVPEKEIAVLAGQYLKVLVLGAPAYAAFESAKRYVQAQGHFAATMYVLLIAAPINIFLHWLFVWQLKWGFIGCPIAVVITENLMPLLLFLYVRFVGGMECWPGFTKKAFANWGPMIRLAIPGLVMVMAEFLAFEILTLASARFGATYLGAQTVLQSLSVITFSLPFPISIAASTRVANLIGATLPDAAKVTGRVTIVFGTVVGIFNVILLSSLRYKVPQLFTSEQDVIELAAKVMPINAAFQLFDALAAQMNGLLRGVGRQEVGGYIGLFAYYVVAVPVSFATAFGLGWELYGLWTGPAIALAIVAISEAIYLYKISWSKAAEEAAKRNALE